MPVNNIFNDWAGMGGAGLGILAVLIFIVVVFGSRAKRVKWQGQTVHINQVSNPYLRAMLLAEHKRKQRKWRVFYVICWLIWMYLLLFKSDGVLAWFGLS